MKKNNKTYTSRRDFVRKVVAGSAVAALANEEVNAAAEPKPGGQIDHPRNSNFKGKRKTPGWLPDTTEIDDEYLFLDEAILLSDTNPRKFDAFPVPNRFPIPDAQGNPTQPQGNPFQEPRGGTAEQWNQFNAWILGGPFNKKANNPFDHLIEVLADRARRYNAALYWMRRLHLYENHPNQINQSPPMNPGNPDEVATPPPSAGYHRAIRAAQSKWKRAVFDLKAVLSGDYDPPQGAAADFVIFENIWADFLRVNDYIVSMRVVAQADPAATVLGKGNMNTFELGGSSSSHISVSSAFCPGCP
jgi:hypothetical protein